MNTRVRSALGTSSFGEKAPKSFVVEDESEFPADMPVTNPLFNHAAMKAAPKMNHEEVKQYREEVKKVNEGKGKITPQSRERIELILGLSKLYKEITIDDMIFKLESLSSRALTEASISIAAFNKMYDNEVVQFNHLRADLLSRSLVEINGKPVEVVLGISTREELYEFILDMDDNAVALLFVGYHELKTKSDELQSVQNNKEVNKIVAEIKK